MLFPTTRITIPFYLPFLWSLLLSIQQYNKKQKKTKNKKKKQKKRGEKTRKDKEKESSFHLMLLPTIRITIPFYL
jgi:hypothetical protein